MNQNNVRGWGSLDKDILPKSNKNKRKRAVRGFFVLLFVVLLCGVGYGFTSVILEGVKKQKLVAGILDLDLYEGEEVIMENLYPIANEVGLIQEKSFDFRLTNTSGEDVNYLVKLVKVNTSNELALTDVVYGLTKGVETSTGILSELNDGIIATDTIKGNQTISYELRFWLREDITDPDTTYNKTLKYKIKVEVNQKLTFNDLLKQKEDTTTNIDFSKISSATNGRGIYKYQEDGEDIYYWRGKVTDNHIVFAGFCWEGVRTTKTGGLKMIYDGVPATLNGKQTCSNTGSESRLSVGHIAFNPSDSDNAYIGYMYGLTGVNTELNNPQCIKLNSTRTQAEVGGESTEAECIANGGKWATTAYEATHANIVDSTIKTAIDTWFSTSNLNTTENLKRVEDAVYCNDRTIDQNLGAANGYTGYTMLGYGKNLTIYHSTARVGINLSKPMPSLGCNQKKDRFTVSEENGNGDLTYPVGLLTADESALAGGVFDQSNNDYYLHTGSHYHLLSPYRFGNSGNYTFLVYSSGKLSSSVVINLYGIRPVISLSPSVLPNLTGTGTETSPYVINVN